MKQTVRYSGTKAQNIAAAEKDCKFYLGTPHYFKACKTLADSFADRPGQPLRNYRTARLMLSFVGIRGRWPVRAMVQQACIVLRDRAAKK